MFEGKKKDWSIYHVDLQKIWYYLKCELINFLKGEELNQCKQRPHFPVYQCIHGTFLPFMAGQQPPKFSTALSYHVVNTGVIKEDVLRDRYEQKRKLSNILEYLVMPGSW